MGGLGSGSRVFKKGTVEGRTALDTRDLRRLNLLVPGTTNRTGRLQWPTRDGSGSSLEYAISVRPTYGALVLEYRVGGEPFRYPITLEATGCHLGGVRWWFRCPLSRAGVACGRRVRKLYFGGRYYGCRQCLNLTYRSSQESDARVYALARAGLGALGNPSRMSVTQLGLAMKALRVIELRGNRCGRSNRDDRDSNAHR